MQPSDYWLSQLITLNLYIDKTYSFSSYAMHDLLMMNVFSHAKNTYEIVGKPGYFKSETQPNLPDNIHYI